MSQPPAADREQGSIAYLTHTYPNYSTTFTQDELRLLSNEGLSIQVYSLRRPPKAYMTPELSIELQRTTYLRPSPLLALLTSHMRTLRQKPRLYFKTLWKLLSASVSSPVEFLKSGRHFIEAIPFGEDCLANNIRTIHVQFADTAATYAAVAYHVYQIPYSVAIHAYDIFHHRFTNDIIRFRIEMAHYIRVISEFNKQWLLEHIGIQADKIEVIHCGVDVHKFNPVKPSKQAPVLILSVGRLTAQKGHQYLLEACRKLLDEDYHFSCKIIGSGPDEATLRAILTKLGLEGCSELVGVVPHSEITDYLAASTMFVLSCCQAEIGAMDGIPVALMEAMAMGIPVISTTVSGIPELIEDRVNGLLVPDKDSIALSHAIERLIQDEPLRRRLGQKGREKIMTEFNLDQNVSDLARRLPPPARSIA